MPTAAKFQTPWMGGGPIQAYKGVTVRDATDTSDATVYTDSAGDVEGDNPVTTDESGLLTAYLAPGRYVLVDDDGQSSSIVVSPPGADTPEALVPFTLPAGAVLDTETYDDPIAIDGGNADAKIPTVVLPAECAVMGFALEGDEFPRVVFASDPTSFGALFIGDGTYDPVGAGAGVNLTGDGDLSVYGVPGRHVVTSRDVRHALPGTGPVIAAPDNSKHRIVVANDGTLSTEVVV